MKTDIRCRADIELLVDLFYKEVRANTLLGYIFDDIAKVTWSRHLPKMYSFWASLLLGEQNFSGNPMQKHVELSKITPLTQVEFNEWLRLFCNTFDHLFEGKKAEEAKSRAEHIAKLMLYKIESA